MKDKGRLTGRGRKSRWGWTESETLSLNFSRSTPFISEWSHGSRFAQVPNTYNSSGQACSEGPSPSLESGSVDASRHRVSFTNASSRQGPCINHVQCDSPAPACWPQTNCDSSSAHLYCCGRRRVQTEIHTNMPTQTEKMESTMLSSQWLVF